MALNNPISGLNKIFDNRIRLGVMSSLMVNDEISFNDLKGLLEVTDGNLATHLQTLEESGFLKVHKGFIGRKTNTTYSITRAGEKAFKDHLGGLEKMIQGIK
ncbi:MAG TPA: transcriptional regulator [Flavisolibacter sp.]|jgi:DNA-binding MarR family transcriptional regulator|nr:transcriptional regulator [Flavisolibacter sp.]